MNEDSVVHLRHPGDFEDPLTDVLRQGARRMLVQAVEAEVASFLEAHLGRLTEDGRRRLMRHGHLPERAIQTGIGPIPVR
jgi:putative transposase